MYSKSSYSREISANSLLSLLFSLILLTVNVWGFYSYSGLEISQVGEHSRISTPASVFADGWPVVSPLNGTIDQSFRPTLDRVPGNIRATAVQPDGKILAGGYFRTLNGVRYDSIVRLNPDNSIDASFTAAVIGQVMAIAVQTDGKIVIGGSFRAVNGVGRNRLARLNADGSLDTTFNIGSGANGTVNDIVMQPDGKILIGGAFTIINSASRNCIARLNASGSVDSGFTSPLPFPPPPQVSTFTVPSIIFTLALQTDGKIVAGGFIVLNYQPQSIRRIVRFNTNGSVDSSLNTQANSDVYDIAVQPDGKLVIAGFFTTVNSTTRRYIARINSDGTLDISFDAGTTAAAPIQTVTLRTDGKILFGPLTALSSSGVANQLNSNGSLDVSFLPTEPMTGSVYSIVSPTASGKTLVFGSFFSIFDDFPNTALRFNADGTQDGAVNLDSTALGGVRAIVAQSDGKVIVGGNFNRVNGEEKLGLVRLNTDGTIDSSFGTSSSGFQSTGTQVTELLVQADGKILVAGAGLTIGNTSGYRVIRVNPDGTSDTSFVPPAGIGVVKAIAIQADGKVLFSPAVNSTTGMSRMNTDGSLDTSFNCSLNLSFESIVVLPDGKVLTGGPFSFGYVSSGSGSEFHNGVLRLNSDGSHDRTFISGLYSDGMVGAFSSVYALERLPDGRILVGGTIYASATSPAAGITRLNESGTIDGTFQQGSISSPYEDPRVEDIELFADGSILAGGLFNSFGGSQQGNVVRLQANGSVNVNFSASSDHTIYKLAVQNDQKVLIGGDFNTVNGTVQSAVARLLGGSSAQGNTLFDYDGDGRADLSVRRPSDGLWYILRGTAGYMSMAFGEPGDMIAPADYDGDGKTDVAMFRPTTGQWFIFNIGSQTFVTFSWGANGDLPVPADHDGDGKADLVVFRPSTNTWHTRFANGTFSTTAFGVAGDKPVIGDFDGDGKADIAVYRPSDNNWYILKTGFGFFIQTWGVAGDIPVPADYDGDGKTDVAVFRPSTGQWFRIQSTAGFDVVNWGQAGDQPIPADYDGDGKSDVAVFRPSNATWYIVGSTSGQLIQNYGVAGDVPTEGAFIY